MLSFGLVSYHHRLAYQRGTSTLEEDRHCKAWVTRKDTMCALSNELQLCSIDVKINSSISIGDKNLICELNFTIPPKRIELVSTHILGAKFFWWGTNLNGFKGISTHEPSNFIGGCSRIDIQWIRYCTQG